MRKESGNSMNARQFKKHNTLIEELLNTRLTYSKRGCNYKKLLTKRFYKSVYQLNRKRIKPLKPLDED